MFIVPVLESIGGFDWVIGYGSHGSVSSGSGLFKFDREYPSGRCSVADLGRACCAFEVSVMKFWTLALFVIRRSVGCRTWLCCHDDG